MGAPDVAWLKDHIRHVPDFPQVGVGFKDLTPLLADAGAFAGAVEALARPFDGAGITKVAGVEARGFIVAAPVAVRLGAGFVPVRKTGKLPWATRRATYDLEYGTDVVEIHADAVAPGDRVLIVDDVIATGGTALAAIELVEGLGATVAGLAFVVDIALLGGRARLADRLAARVADRAADGLTAAGPDVVVLVAYE